MGLELSSPPATVCLDNLGAIESDTLEWVDGNKHDSTICVDAVLRISVADGVEDCIRVSESDGEHAKGADAYRRVR